MHEDLTVIEEPLFCCNLPLTVRLTGRSRCRDGTCGELRNLRVSCRILERRKRQDGLFEVRVALTVAGSFKGARLKGARILTLCLPFAGEKTQLACRPVPGRTKSFCFCANERVECEVCLQVQVCVVVPCPAEDDECGSPRKVKRIVRFPTGDCPLCKVLKEKCPPPPPAPCP